MPAATRPTPADPLVALADRCVQCGLCLPACPTYAHDRIEAESPRGRIALARAWTLGTIDATVVGDTHLDHCLACRSCEAVCPAGVRYGELLVAARDAQRARREPGWQQRLIEALAARPRLLTGLLGLYRRTCRGLPRRWQPLPRPPAPAPSPSSRLPAGAQRVGLFTGCVARAYEPGVRAALVALCGALGVTVVEPAGQTCCGSLHAHAGASARADRQAAANRAAFAGLDPVLTLASGCHESLARSHAGRSVDALEFLASRLDRLRFRAGHERVAVHLPCTQRNVVRSVPALRQLLAAVPGLEVVELDAGYGCCGAAGTQMLTDPARAADYRQPLLDQFAASGATRLLSANIGCRLHLAGGTPLPVQHPIELLAERLDAVVAPPP